MSEAAKKLLAVLLELPVAERLEIADNLYASLPPAPHLPTEGTPEFDAMLDQRLRDHESGKDEGVPAVEFFRELREARDPRTR
jgi:putative addiction module component (TIGR02574 family)